MTRSGQPKAILVIDDDDPVRASTALLLEASGYRVIEATNGVEALAHLAAAEAEDIGLIVFDLQMPKMSGWTFREHQLADSATADIPTVVLTGSPLGRDDLKRLRIRAALSKPFMFEELLRFVRAHVEPAR